MTPQEEAQKEIDAVMHDQAHPLYERFHRSDPQAIERMNELWKATAVPQPESPPNPPPIVPTDAAPGPSGPGEIFVPGTHSIETGDAEIAEAHLKAQWGSAYDENFKQMEAGRDSIFNRSDRSDEVIYDAVINSPLVNNPQALELLRTIGREPLSPNVADIRGLTPPQKEQMADVAAGYLLRSTGLPADSSHPILRELDRLVSEGKLSKQQVVDWGARLHQRLFVGR
jgi:hypothetical protein